MILRPYQRESLDALYSYWDKGGGNGLIVIPTGGGKSLIIATMVRELLEQYPRMRIGIVTHVKELIAQNFAELIRYFPQAPAGIHSAGLQKRDTRSQVLFCGIQSVHKKADQLGGFDLLIIDEVHLLPRNTDTTYNKFIASLKAIVPDMRIVGLTATPFRLDSGRLDLGEGRLFDKIVYEANVRDLIENGYLSPLISKATVTKFDLTGVGKRGGDFIPGALEIAVDKDWVTKEAIKELVLFGQGRRSWLAFCAGVKHAEHVRDEIRAHDISCEMITGETSHGDRNRIIGEFRAGRIKCLTSVGVLTTGFNVPHVDLLAMLRPTCSPGLYIQIVGRAFRNAPGKKDALILDYAGNVARFGPVDTIEVTRGGSKKTGEDESVMAKECPKCHALVALNIRQCPHCDHVFPVKEPDPLPKHDAKADSESAILSSAQPVWVPVYSIKPFRHAKPGSPTSMRVEYFCGLSTHRAWQCFDHEGFPRAKAERWWREMKGLMPLPKNVDEALARFGELSPVDEIQVRPEGKYFAIVGTRLKQKEEV